MTIDIFGQQTTLASGPALDSWNKTQLAFLAHGAATPEHLGAALTAAPEFALGHAIKGIFYDVGISICLRHRPGLRGVKPDVFQIALGCWRQQVCGRITCGHVSPASAP